MEKTLKPTLFNLSLLSSFLFFLSIFFGEKLWSELWVLYAFIVIGLVAFFGFTFIWSFIFWTKSNSNYRYRFIPFCVNLCFLILIIVLPLNYIRNRAGFYLFSQSYEEAVALVQMASVNTHDTRYVLPSGYKLLSNGGGEVTVVNKGSAQAILFYTFRGTPEGLKGFVRVSNGKSLDFFSQELAHKFYKSENLGNNWYYISAE